MYREMEVEQAYWAWIQTIDNIPPIDVRLKCAKGVMYLNDSLCTLHREDFNKDFTLADELFDTNCRKCVHDLNNVTHTLKKKRRVLYWSEDRARGI